MGEKTIYYIGKSSVLKFGYSSMMVTLTKALRLLGLKEKDKVEIYVDPVKKEIILRKEKGILDKPIIKIGD